MPSPIDRRSAPAVLTARAFSLCLLMGATLQIMENLIPRLPIFPWLKLGLSHIVLLPFLLRFGTGPAAMLLLGRNLLTLLFAGGALTTFLVGSVSGTAAMFVGGWAVRAAMRRKWLGLAGAGMIMAALMNLAQLVVAEGLLVHHSAFYFQLAPMLIWSLVSGAAVAWLAFRCWPVLEDMFRVDDGGVLKTKSEDSATSVAQADKSAGFPWGFIACLVVLGGLFLLQEAWQLGLALTAFLFVSPAFRGFGGLRSDLISLARGWPWFLYLAWLHLGLDDGEYLWGGLITKPGAEAFALYGARLANLILLGPYLARTIPAARLGGAASVYARGLAGCLPLLPGLHAAAMEGGREFSRNIRRWVRPRGESAAEGRGHGGSGEALVLRRMLEGFAQRIDSR